MNDEIISRVNKFVDEIGEFTDSVQVVVTYPSLDGNGSTQCYERGTGNYYARLGAILEWVDVQKQYSRNWAIRKDNED